MPRNPTSHPWREIIQVIDDGRVRQHSGKFVDILLSCGHSHNISTSRIPKKVMRCHLCSRQIKTPLPNLAHKQ